MARKQKARNLKKRRSVLIGAGPTEKAYIEHLTHIKGYRIETHPRFCRNDTPFYMDKFVQHVLEDGGTAVCLYDEDESERSAKIQQKLDEFVTKYKDNPNVMLCGSMPSIEYWFLLHYEKVNRYFGTSKRVIKALNKHMEYEKTEKFLSNLVGWKHCLRTDACSKRCGTRMNSVRMASRTRIYRMRFVFWKNIRKSDSGFIVYASAGAGVFCVIRWN